MPFLDKSPSLCPSKVKKLEQTLRLSIKQNMVEDDLLCKPHCGVRAILIINLRKVIKVNKGDQRPF